MLAGASTQFGPVDEDIRFEFANNQGSYRGRLTDRGIVGFWIRPAVTKDPRFPGGASQAFATPLDLAPARRRSLERNRQDVAGSLHPIPADLQVRGRHTDGRVPQPGAERARPGLAVPGRNRWQVGAIHRGGRSRQARACDHGAAPRRTRSIGMRWEDLDAEIDLARRTDAEAASFFPRPPGSATYTYEQPPGLDGWLADGSGPGSRHRRACGHHDDPRHRGIRSCCATAVTDPLAPHRAQG